MANLGEINVHITVDSSGLEKGLGDSTREINKFSSSASGKGTKASAAMRAGLVGIAVAAVGASAALAKTITSTTDLIAKQSALARSLDATVTGLRSVNQAAADRNIDGLDSSLARLNRRLGAVENGTGPAVNAVKALNLNIRQLAAADADERIALIADAIQGFGGSSQQATRYLQDLGFQQQGVYELFREGGSEIRKYRDQIEGMGRGVSEIDAQVLENVNLELKSLGDGFEGLKTQLAVNFAPVIGELGRMFNDWSTQSVDGVSRVDKVMEYLFKGIKFVGDAVEALKRIMTLSMHANRLAVAGLGEIFMWVVDKTIRPLVAQVQKIFEGLGKLQHVPGLGTIGKGAEAAAKGLNFVGDGIDVVRDKLAGIRQESLEGLKESASGLFDELTWGSKAESFAKEARAKAQEIAGIQIEERKKAEAAVAGITEKNWVEHYNNLIRQKERELELAQLYGNKEQEQLELQFEIRQAELNKALEEQELTREHHREELEHAEAVHNQRMLNLQKEQLEEAKRLDAEAARHKLQGSLRLFSDLGRLMNTGSRKLFEIGKLGAISEAAVAGRKAALDAYAWGMSAGGPPLASIARAASMAATAADIAGIAKQKYGSGSVAMGGDISANVEAAAPQRPVQDIHVQGIDKDSFFSSEQVGNLLNEFMHNGGRIVGWS